MVTIITVEGYTLSVESFLPSLRFTSKPSKKRPVLSYTSALHSLPVSVKIPLTEEEFGNQNSTACCTAEGVV